jgi:hypothetical protein
VRKIDPMAHLCLMVTRPCLPMCGTYYQSNKVTYEPRLNALNDMHALLHGPWTSNVNAIYSFSSNCIDVY